MASLVFSPFPSDHPFQTTESPRPPLGSSPQATSPKTSACPCGQSQVTACPICPNHERLSRPLPGSLASVSVHVNPSLLTHICTNYLVCIHYVLYHCKPFPWLLYAVRWIKFTPCGFSSPFRIIMSQLTKLVRGPPHL